MGLSALLVAACGSENPVSPDLLKDNVILSGTNSPFPIFDDFVSPKAKIISFDLNDITELDELLSQQLASAGLLDGATLQFKRQKGSSDSTEDSWESSFIRDYEIAVEGTPICDAQVKAFKLANSSQTAALAHFPTFDSMDIDGEWSDLADATNKMELAIKARGVDFDSAILGDSQQCFQVKDERLIPAWDLSLVVNDMLYTALVSSDGVLDLTPVNFHAEGTATVYAKNPHDGELKAYKLSQMVDDGTLENTYFTVSTTGNKVEESDLVFNFDPDDEEDEFDQTSLFVHANRQYDWFRERGHDWQGDQKITIVAHAVINGSTNNALYTPGTSSTPPRIQVGDGDGLRLRNLPKDGDVVSHELNHHVVYDTLKEVKGESLVLHEGLADYFTFARTEDPCLGESICPSGSDVNCEVDAQCLRTAENEYVLGKNTKDEAHFKSQFISGLLWDLRDDEVPAEKLDKIVYKGISVLLEASGYHDFILGLLLADEDLYDGKYCDDIYDAATDRGLTDFISDFGCGGELPTLSALNNNGGSTTSTQSRRGSTSDDPFCGVVGSSSKPSGSIPTPLWVFFLILPLLWPVFKSMVPRPIQRTY